MKHDTSCKRFRQGKHFIFNGGHFTLYRCRRNFLDSTGFYAPINQTLFDIKDKKGG